MKKTLVAVAALAVVGAASAQSSVTIYGKIDAALASRTEKTGGVDTANNKGLEVNSSNHNGSRWGLRGTEDLGGGLNAVFLLENGFSVDDGTMTGFTRQAYVGFSGGFGAFTVGRQYTPYDTTLAVYDPHGATGSSALGYVFGAGVTNITGATAAAAAGFGGVKAGQGFHGDQTRASNALLYVTPNMGGLTAQAMWAPGENKNPVAGATRRDSDSYTGFNVNYANGPFGVALAYERIRTTAAAAVPTSQSTNAWVIGAQYDLGVAKLYGQYERAKSSGTQVAGAAGTPTAADGTDTGWGLGVSVPMGSMTLGLSYARETGDPVGPGAEFKTRAFGAQLIYALSKRTRLYTSYLSGKSDSLANVTTKTSQFFAGMQHDF